MIITFYSYKGGTGRTMALANIAVVLAQAGHKVLAVDFDLEAPGLVKFFEELDPKLPEKDGLIDLLLAKSARTDGSQNWRDYVAKVSLGEGEGILSVITSGHYGKDYAAKVLDFDWGNFFEKSEGGEFFEELRKEWGEEYDFTLIDSRTGITDTGGICTISLPDLIVPVFTANHQSVDGVIEVLHRAQAGRQALAYDRAPAIMLPLPSRFDSRTELKSAEEWMGIFAKKFGVFYRDWLPRGIHPRQILERTKLPYVAYFSFGERLPVMSQGISDPESLGYAMHTVARLIEGELANAAEIIEGVSSMKSLSFTRNRKIRHISDADAAEEPRLTIQRRSARSFLRGFLPPSSIPTAVLALIGVISLFLSGNILLPFEPITTLEGTGSTAAFFDDTEVQKILLKNRIQVHVTQSGSRETVTSNIESFDFVFPSGQPAAKLIADRLPHFGEYRPFVSPIVFATYSAYAKTLQSAGIATPQGGAQQANPLYYDLNVEKFLQVVEDGRTWDELGIADHGIENGNRILPHTTDVCTSNSAAGYLAMVAFLKNNSHVPVSEQEAMVLAGQIKPLFTGQGFPANNLLDLYPTPEGKAISPIVVMNESQYLAYQLHQFQTGPPDPERVLLYPTVGFQTQPEFFSINSQGDRLGRLIISDPDLRRRALELGYRVVDTADNTTSKSLPEFLQQQGFPVPSPRNDYTVAYLPELSILEQMINFVGDCP